MSDRDAPNLQDRQAMVVWAASRLLILEFDSARPAVLTLPLCRVFYSLDVTLQAIHD